METSKTRATLSGDSPLQDKTVNGNVLPLEVLQKVELDILLEELADVIEAEGGILTP